MSVTRSQIADLFIETPALFPATRADLIDAATRADASQEVVAALQTLPNHTYGHLRDLWPRLPQVPVGF
jgi:hypothetical protein